MKEKRLSILGSTGSIGVQSLDVARECGFKVVALAAGRNVTLLEQQARAFCPQVVAMSDEVAAADLACRLGDTGIRVLSGEGGVEEAATLACADTVIVAVVGIAGLKPTLAAIKAGKRVALANKESLVCAGELVMDEAKKRGVEILPVDSEHSAIFQCLQGSEKKEVKRLILTASGGPFFGYNRKQLEQVTLEQALRHPNWTMGAKVTIDSASLMNKGLEFLEAMALFSMTAEQISVLVHRESIIHSMVEYCDHAVIAQMGTPDMRLPIQYALTWPERISGPAEALDFLTCPQLSFASPDLDAFPCLALAMEVARMGGIAPAVMNAANEIAVACFLRGEIDFLDIPRIVAHTLSQACVKGTQTLEAVFEGDAQARVIALNEAARITR